MQTTVELDADQYQGLLDQISYVTTATQEATNYTYTIEQWFPYVVMNQLQQQERLDSVYWFLAVMAFFHVLNFGWRCYEVVIRRSTTRELGAVESR